MRNFPYFWKFYGWAKSVEPNDIWETTTNIKKIQW